MVPGPLAVVRRRRTLWALLGLSLALAGCASAGIIDRAGGPQLQALGAPPARAHAAPSTAGASGATGAPPGEALVATSSVASLPVFPWPGAARPGLALANPDTQGAPLTLLVAAVAGDWVQTYLPVRPNGAQGWVPRADVTLAPDPFRITVSLMARRLDVYEDGAVVAQVPVAVGSPTSPTPVGTFFVTEVLQLTDPQNAYGPYALGLSAFSDTYSSFDGGPGQVAVHGTNEPWVIGGYASHGCIRLANGDIARVAAIVRAGTPVVIGL